MIAAEVVEKLKANPAFELAEAVGPGFINLKVKGEFLQQYLLEMQKDPDLSVEKTKSPKTIMLDLRRTQRGKAASCGTSAFCYYRGEH